MKKIAWVTDSTAFLDEEMVNHPDVYQVPMTIILDEEEFVDGVDLEPAELYSRLKSLDTPPKTSQPSIGAFRELYDRLGEEYETIISILVSGKLSGTVESSRQAAQISNHNVITIDSKILSYPLTALLKRGIELSESGKSADDIMKVLESLRDATKTYVLIGSLEQLHRSGRMTAAKFYLGSMLNIKPIIEITEGVLEMIDKARSEKKAKGKISSLLKASHDKQRVKEGWILYGLNKEAADQWQRELEEEFPEILFHSYPLAAVVGVHAGEQTLGLSWNQML
ncbi:DegV family protein [Bacillus massilinigeriensis]|uniref:DegV family protein n=1 Tax=Bacillus mediterraneensis TaxID=1805474 RepID=UPI0008F8BAC3|nr:DegV family protein [Bacillus mediterraneensis]